MIPVFFESVCAAYFPGTGRYGVVLVGSPWFEDLCGHRFLHAIAEELAARGTSALLIDLAGTGDSLPLPDQPAASDVWASNVTAAMHWLQESGGCDDVALAGFRLGALIAAQAIAHVTPARLAVIAPPLSGKAYLRELRALSMVIGGQPAASDAALNLAGFRIPQAIQQSIAGLDWSGLGHMVDRPVMTCVVTAEQARPVQNVLGQDVPLQMFAGYERLMCDPTASSLPKNTVSGVCDWLTAGVAAGQSQPIGVYATTQSDGAFVETGLTFGDDATLSGILCAPVAGPRGPLVLFTNPGGIRRIGWGGMWVELARRLAASGIGSFRFDFSNLAPKLAGDGPAFHYGETIWTEIVAAADRMRALGFGPIIPVGACSGAYHCLRAARFETDFQSIVLVNQLCYQWGPSHALPLSAWMAQKAADMQRRRMSIDDQVSDLSRLRARLTVSVMDAAKSGAKQALSRLRALADLLPDSNTETAAGDIATTFQAIAARGGQIAIVHALGDASIAEFDRHVREEQLLDMPNLRRHFIPDCDHMLTQEHARGDLLEIIRATASRNISVRDQSRQVA